MRGARPAAHFTLMGEGEIMQRAAGEARGIPTATEQSWLGAMGGQEEGGARATPQTCNGDGDEAAGVVCLHSGRQG